MSAIGGNPLNTLLKIPGIQVFMSIGGSAYGLMEEHTWDAHYTELLDPVGGSAAQVISAGAFLMELTATILYSTDLPDASWSTLSNGDLPMTTIVILLYNAEGSVRTITLPYCKIFRHGGKHTKDQLYRKTIRAISAGVPTID
jgi:hypothetical protein